MDAAEGRKNRRFVNPGSQAACHARPRSDAQKLAGRSFTAGKTAARHPNAL